MTRSATPRKDFAMADVSQKPVTSRRALAAGEIQLGPEAYAALEADQLPKGDPRPMAEIAGMQAAKLTPQLLPLCHPIALNRVALHCAMVPERSAVRVYVLAEIAAQTGVEMEALTGLQVALLTIWDLCKPVNAALSLEDTRLLYKSGGKQGEWVHPQGLDATAKSILGLR